MEFFGTDADARKRFRVRGVYLLSEVDMRFKIDERWCFHWLTDVCTNRHLTTLDLAIDYIHTWAWEDASRKVSRAPRTVWP